MSLVGQEVTLGGSLGTYQPQGLYSFEFHDRNNESSRTEIFLLLPPESVQSQYGYRMTLHKTFGGQTFDFFGVDSPTFTLSGSLWSYWIDMLPAPFGTSPLGNLTGVPAPLAQVANQAVSNIGNNLAKAASSYAGTIFPVNTMTGLEEFFRLKYMLYDFFMPNAKDTVPISLMRLGTPLPGLGWLQRKAKNSENNFNNISLIYHDYDDNVHWEVVPTGVLSVSRDKSDPFTARWSMSFAGIRDTRTKPYSVPIIDKKVDSQQVMREIAEALANANPMTMLYQAEKNLVREAENFNKLSVQTVANNYNDAISRYRQGQVSSYREVIMQSDFIISTSRDAIMEIPYLIGKTPDEAIAESESQNQSQNILDFGVSEEMYRISLFMLMASEIKSIGVFESKKAYEKDGRSINNLKYMPSITEDMFSQSENAASNTYRLVENNWKPYVVKEGDTLWGIASREMGDYTRYPEIVSLNRLDVRMFSSGGYTGQIIKIPSDNKNVYTNDRNMVYTWESSIIEESLGRDILKTSENDIQLDNSGDIALSGNIDGFTGNIVDILQYGQGSLILYPEWGNPVTIGDITIDQTLKVIQAKIIEAIKRDPRVDRVEITSYRQEGDKLYNNITVYTITGESVQV